MQLMSASAWHVRHWQAGFSAAAGISFGLFAVILVVWMAFNIWATTRAVFDSLSVILLNLVLSCLAAIQAPIIMMSQKRQGGKRSPAFGKRLPRESQGRARNPESAREGRSPDHAAVGARLAEIQQIQLEIMQDLVDKRR